MLAPIKILSRSEELAFDDCKRILDYLKGSLEQQVPHLPHHHRPMYYRQDHHHHLHHHHHHHLYPLYHHHHHQVDGDSPIVKDWALGKKHVFLTEGTRQHLEKLRTEKRNASVTLIQSGIVIRHYLVLLLRHYSVNYPSIANFQYFAVFLLERNGRQYVEGFKATLQITSASIRGPASQAGQDLR